MTARAEFDEEHATRPDESVAVNEDPSGAVGRDEGRHRPAASAEASWGTRSFLHRSMAEALVSAISTGQLSAVSGAATLRRRNQGPPAFDGPRSMLSQSGAPTRVVAMSSLRRLLRRR